MSTTKKYSYLIVAAILFNLGLVVLLPTILLFLKDNDSLFKYGGWASVGLFVFIVVIICLLFNKRFKVNFDRLFRIRLLQGVFFFAISFVFNFNPLSKVYQKYCNYVLVDDGYTTDDEENSRYVTTFQFFIPIADDIVGIKIPEGVIQTGKDDHYLEYEDGSRLGDINFNYAIFWQYAKNEGYNEVENGNYRIGSDFSNIFKVGPYYLLELILKNISSSLIFIILVIGVSLKWKDYFFKTSAEEQMEKKMQQLEKIKATSKSSEQNSKTKTVKRLSDGETNEGEPLF